MAAMNDRHGGTTTTYLTSIMLRQHSRDVEAGKIVEKPPTTEETRVKRSVFSDLTVGLPMQRLCFSRIEERVCRVWG
eukprot:COSAG01_NODE_1685_length_9495_cov_61.609728_10_plen_77_part_00